LPKPKKSKKTPANGQPDGLFILNKAQKGKVNQKKPFSPKKKSGVDQKPVNGQNGNKASPSTGLPKKEGRNFKKYKTKQPKKGAAKKQKGKSFKK